MMMKVFINRYLRRRANSVLKIYFINQRFERLERRVSQTEDIIDL